MRSNFSQSSLDLYSKASDEEIILLISKESKIQGDYALEFLLDKYKSKVLKWISPYFLFGSDREDIIQEGMIGLFKAIRDYNGTIPFKSFAELCVKRQTVSAIKTSLRLKHLPHLNSTSLDKRVNDTEINLFDVLPNPNSITPEQYILAKEYTSELQIVMLNYLSELERNSLELYSQGLSYKEISQKLDRKIKSIDASLNRAKIKLKKFLNEDDFSYRTPTKINIGD